MADQLDITRVKYLSDLTNRLGRTSSFTSVQNLGLWSREVHAKAQGSMDLKYENPAQMTHVQLSQHFAQWNHELVRVQQTVGWLEALGKGLDLDVKRARARALADLQEQRASETAEALREDPPRKLAKYTAAELAAAVDLAEGVEAAEDARTEFQLLVISAQAYKESCLSAVNGLSREMSYRQAQLQGRGPQR